MEKKAYMIPTIHVMTVELHRLMNQISGGGDKEGDPQIDPTPDEGGAPNRSRRNYSVWEEEDIE